ncbi:MAG: DUF1638 domain-containing protein [Candidatus Methanoperedens sp.]|nr:DUF1638 domain-containing protein [Candidatus Methanoperedens sp.]
MPVLSIIACDMFEDELTYVLSKDSKLEQLILVEKSECFGLQRKLKSLGCLPALIPLDRIPEILKGEKSQSFPAILKPFCDINFIEKIRCKLENRHKTKVTVVANVLKMGLHIDNELLRAEVYRNIREMSRFSDRILIFYGTCGHSLVDIEKDFEGLGCQLYFLKDDKGEIVEDCISVALGGNDAYARAMVNSEGEGTFYLTPMWASGWQEFPKEKFVELSENDKKYIKRYRRVAKIDTGLSYELDFDENVRDFARFFNLKIVELQGSKKIAEQSYQDAKKFP